MVPELEVVSRVRLVPKMEVVPEVGKFSRTQTSQEKKNMSNSTHKLTMPQAAGKKCTNETPKLGKGPLDPKFGPGSKLPYI